MWTVKEGCLGRMGSLSKGYKMEEEERGVVTRGAGRKGEEEMGEEECIGGVGRGEKHPKGVIQAGQCVHACTRTCACKCVCAHVEGFTCIHAHVHVKETSEFLLF